MEMETIQERKTYSSPVSESVTVKYTVESIDGQPVEAVHGRILKGDNTTVAGYFNSNRNGESSLTFLPGGLLSSQEKQAVSAMIYADEPDLFSTNDA